MAAPGCQLAADEQHVPATLMQVHAHERARPPFHQLGADSIAVALAGCSPLVCRTLVFVRIAFLSTARCRVSRLESKIVRMAALAIDQLRSSRIQYGTGKAQRMKAAHVGHEGAARESPHANTNSYRETRRVCKDKQGVSRRTGCPFSLPFSFSPSFYRIDLDRFMDRFKIVACEALCSVVGVGR